MILVDKDYALEKAENQYYLGLISEQTKIEIVKFLNNLPSAQPEPSQVARDIATIIENEKDMRVIAQSEIKPIDYQDCANAMLRMWMDKVVTDGEYNRIMDKLNAFWETKKEGEME